MTTVNTLLLVDGGRLHSYWHVHEDSAARKMAEYVDRVLDTLTALGGQYAAAVFFDGKGSAMSRREENQYYKPNRTHNDELTRAKHASVNLIQQAGHLAMVCDRCEADDAIAVLAQRQLADVGDRVVIASSDKDFKQLLVRERCRLIKDLDRGRPKWYTSVDFEAEHGFPAYLFPYYQAIAGDPSDGVRGWEGVGPTTATKIIRKFWEVLSVKSDAIAGDLQVFHAVMTRFLQRVVDGVELEGDPSLTSRPRCHAPAFLKDFEMCLRMVTLPHPASPTATELGWDRLNWR